MDCVICENLDLFQENFVYHGHWHVRKCGVWHGHATELAAKRCVTVEGEIKFVPPEEDLPEI